MSSPSTDHGKPIVRGLLTFAIFWLTGFTLVQLGQHVFGTWVASQVGQTLACALGVAIALRLQVKLIAYVLAGQLAFYASELALHSIFGNGSVQGGPTHFAVMLAGTLGVLLGWVLSRGQTSEPKPHLTSLVPSQELARSVVPQEFAKNAA